MCGRMTMRTNPSEIARIFDAELGDSAEFDELGPRYNVAPTQPITVVLQRGDEGRFVEHHRWGLVPAWADSPAAGARMINARAESIATSPAFRASFLRRRCIIPADGFYEWRKLPGQKTKQPVYIRRKDGEPLALAGLWESWRPPESSSPDGTDGDTVLRSCTIVTGPANDLVAPVHDRMPVILAPSVWEAWLDPTNDDVEALERLLVAAPSSLLVLHPVGTEVNNVRSSGAGLIEPIPDATSGGPGRLEAPMQGRLL